MLGIRDGVREDEGLALGRLSSNSISAIGAMVGSLVGEAAIGALLGALVGSLVGEVVGSDDLVGSDEGTGEMVGETDGNVSLQLVAPCLSEPSVTYPSEQPHSYCPSSGLLSTQNPPSASGTQGNLDALPSIPLSHSLTGSHLKPFASPA